MDDFNELEEPPPIHRPEPEESPRGFGLFASRPSRRPSLPVGRDYHGSAVPPAARDYTAPPSAGREHSPAPAAAGREHATAPPVIGRDYVPPAPSAVRDHAAPAPASSRDYSVPAYTASRDPGPIVQQSGGGATLALAGLVIVVIVQGWLYFGVRGDLAEMRERVEKAEGSVGQVWETAKGLDQDRMARLALLADSIRTVFDYAQGQVQLWSQRLDENDRARSEVNTRLAGFTSADLAQRSRMDALERQDRTRSIAFEALSRRVQSQDASTRDANATVAYLRGTLGRLDAALSALERRYDASSAAYGQLGGRVETLSGFADGFRRAGLSPDGVKMQLATMSDEIRRIRIRVDSLRSGSRSLTTADLR